MRFPLPFPRRRIEPIDWRRLTAVLLSLVGLVAGSLAWLAYAQAARTEPLVVATQAIPPGTRLTADMLTVIQAPRIRPAALHGLADPAPLLGGYTRTAISPDQIVRPALVQTAPLEQHTYPNDPLPAETLTADVFELARTGLSRVTSQDQINILVLIDAAHGSDPAFQVSAEDAAGSGARTVRVLRALNVLHVTEQAALLEVTHAQSQFLWALTAAQIPFVGELATAGDAPLGPLRPGDADAAFLGTGPVRPPPMPPPAPPGTPAPSPSTMPGERSP